MTQQEIRNRVKQLSTMDDMLNLLNEIKACHQGNELHPFTMKQLEYYSYSKNVKRSYHYFKIPKKTKKNGKTQYREIRAPKGALRWILSYLNVVLQAMYDVPACATGFCPNRSIVDNATLHTGKNYVFNIDLEDFFPSIKQTMIWKKLHYTPFDFKDYTRKDGRKVERQKFANFIANICTYPGKIEEGEHNGCLPQGAPTSPTLTNIICERLDYQLSGLAKRFGVTYSRYADDITFSSDHNVYQRDGEFQKELFRIIESHDFKINEKKTRLLRNNMRQEVTGLIVNEKTNVTKRYINDLRHILHVWKKKGYALAHAEFYLTYKKEKGHVKKGEPCMENVISGKLDFLKMVKGEESSTYKTLSKQFSELVKAHEKENNQFIDTKIEYLATYSYLDFKSAYNTEVETGKGQNGSPYLFFILNGRKQLLSCSKGINILDRSNIEKGHISYCQAEDGKRFYLLHKERNKYSMQRKNEEHLEQKLQELIASLKPLIDDE